MIVLHILLLANLWAGDPNMLDPAMNEESGDAGQVPCLIGCGNRPTPTQKLLDVTNGKKDASKEDADEGLN